MNNPRTIEIYLSDWLCCNINSPHDSLLYPDHDISSLYLSLSLSLNLKTLTTKIRNVSICFKNNFKIFLYSFLIFAKAVLWYNISDTLVIFTTLDLSTRRIFLQSAVLFLKNRYWENLFKVVKGNIFFCRSSSLIYYLDTINIEWTVLNHTNFSRWALPIPYTI